ncbi:MAG TPA: 50S ribosomal protein L15 [Flavilitoribacter sp.]|nr:50S ribosomal protein L15 [Lewinella sp.]MCB9279691.1 50S ribosomal protein L15 [Lewinellaceae bacterium]HMQ59362.1 50S ribosomal protein L15 [Flavilitoribacter sp.]HMQ88015.1 50S ribosomal protein L15 [Flavilitoribacter sp.]
MELHHLRPAKGAVKKRKRIARGQGSGHGGTSTRGHKGDKSRSGHKNKRNFEGGQMPLQMRLPKVGFKNPNRVEFVVFNLGQLQHIADKFGVTEIDLGFLNDKGYAKKADKVKVLGNGKLGAKLSVSVHAVSESAKAAIEGLGGTVNLV